MGGMSTTPKVMSAVAGWTPGSLITREDLAKATGLTGEQVAAVLYRAVKRPDPVVETVERGHVWRRLHTDADQPDTDDGNAVAFDVIERLGGALVLRDANGDLWLAKRIGKADD